MICISIANASHRLALVDMHNAASQCGLLELRLDRLNGEVNLDLLLTYKTKPILATCRRGDEGGDWQGSEEQRREVLRQCLARKVDFVEIELDAADDIAPAPPSKRVIAYNNVLETPEDISRIYSEMLTKQPDVIKIATPVRTPEEAWPLVQVLGRAKVPTVVMGMGKPGIMLAILARKMGAPWVYAALERGMESYFGQPTINDFKAVYHYDDFERGTRLVGVTGFEEPQFVTVALLNTAMRQAGQPTRCLPMSIGELKLFRGVLQAVKAVGVVIDREQQGALKELITAWEPMAQQVEAADLAIASGKDAWQGHFLEGRAACLALEATLQAAGKGPLKGRSVTLFGCDGVMRALAAQLAEAEAAITVLSRNDFGARRLARQVKGQAVPSEESAQAPLETVILGDSSDLAPAELPAGKVICDLTATLRRSEPLKKAQLAGCTIVEPARILLERVALQAEVLSGKPCPREPLVEMLHQLVEE